jgi:hypothetical protein
MKVYISGPMTSMPEKNFPAFYDAEEKWIQRGFEVHNPAREERNHNQSWATCMRHDIEALVSCDAIAMLPGWQFSPGAVLEHAIAHRLEMPVYDAVSFWFLDAEPRLMPVKIDEAGNPVLTEQAVRAAAEESVTQEAHRIVRGPRRSDYDHPLDNFNRIAKIWSIILGTDVAPEQVGLCMVGVKLAREVHKHTRDNLVDVCGYSDTVQLVHEERERREKVENSGS